MPSFKEGKLAFWEISYTEHSLSHLTHPLAKEIHRCFVTSRQIDFWELDES